MTEAKELLLAWEGALVNPGVYPDEIAYMALSRVELELGNLAEARRFALLARDSQASDDPERTKVAGCLAMVEYQAGRYDEARALLDEADADIRGHRGYFDYLVMLYRSRLARDAGEVEQARVCIRDAVNRLLVEGRVVYCSKYCLRPSPCCTRSGVRTRGPVVRPATGVAAVDGPADAADRVGGPAGVLRQCVCRRWVAGA